MLIYVAMSFYANIWGMLQVDDEWVQGLYDMEGMADDAEVRPMPWPDSGCPVLFPQKRRIIVRLWHFIHYTYSDPTLRPSHLCVYTHSSCRVIETVTLRMMTALVLVLGVNYRLCSFLLPQCLLLSQQCRSQSSTWPQSSCTDGLKVQSHRAQPPFTAPSCFDFFPSTAPLTHKRRARCVGRVSHNYNLSKHSWRGNKLRPQKVLVCFLRTFFVSFLWYYN